VNHITKISATSAKVGERIPDGMQPSCDSARYPAASFEECKPWPMSHCR
jgi:hypothetical protein